MNYRNVVEMTAATCVFAAAGCADRSSVARSERTPLAHAEANSCALRILACEYYMPQRGADPTPLSTVYLRSGQVLRFSNPHDVQESRLDDACMARFRDALASAELATLPEVTYVEVDAPYRLIAIWRDNKLRRYAWTERPWGPGASPEEEQFARAWSSARALFDEFRPSTWTAVPDSEQMFKASLNAIWARYPEAPRTDPRNPGTGGPGWPSRPGVRRPDALTARCERLHRAC
jgi:hypothetical protein